MATIDRRHDWWNISRNNKLFKIEVRYQTPKVIKEFSKETPGFVAIHKNPDFKLKSSDLEVLREKVEKHLDDWMKVTFKEMILVRVIAAKAGETDKHYEDVTKLEFSYDEYTIGTFPNGKQIYRYSGDRQGYWDEGDLLADRRSRKSEGGAQYTLIPNTPQNRAALDLAEEKIKALADRIQELFEQQVIEKSLQNSVKLLAYQARQS